MPIKKNSSKSDVEKQEQISQVEEREEHISSLEMSVKFLKNELDRVKQANSSDANNQSSIEDFALSLMNSNDEVELINKTHALLAKYFSVFECNFYLNNDAGYLLPISGANTSEFLNSQVEHLEEQGILQWVFEEKQLKIIPNLDAQINKQSSFIIYPITNINENLGVFIAASSMVHTGFTPETNEKLKKMLDIIALIAVNLISQKEIIDIKRKLDIINNQLMQTSLLLSIGEIAGTVSREIVNPLRMIQANNDLIISGIGSSIRRAEIIKENLNRVEYLNSIITNLAFDINNDPEIIDIKSLINHTLDILQFQIAGEDIKIEKEFDEHSLPINCNKKQLQHVLLNLFLNARDSMPNGGNISIGCFQLGEKKVSITIADNGEGIPEADIPNIFEPHYSKKTGSKKMALNLYMSKRIIEKHKGKIVFVSEQAKGTTFRIILPIVKSNK